MDNLKIEKLEGTIAYLSGLEVEQINTNEFIIFKIDNDIDLQGIKDIIAKLQSKGVKKTFLILPKSIDYCVFKKGVKNENSQIKR